jgi:hypothetical protein
MAIYFIYARPVVHYYIVSFLLISGLKLYSSNIFVVLPVGYKMAAFQANEA